MSPATKNPQFLFGAATAAHQIEGDNTQSDWWFFESHGKKYPVSGKACNSYELYREDRQLVQNLGCNSYRFSIEWARIEPEEGKFSEAAMQHYLDLIDDLCAHGIEPMLTLHHFTNPAWLELNDHGWANPLVVAKFARYVKYVVAKLDGRVRYFITINEPNLFMLFKYIVAVWNPWHSGLFSPFRVARNLISAHNEAYRIIKADNPQAQVGMSVQYIILRAIRNRWFFLNTLLVNRLTYINNKYFYKNTVERSDFIAVNFYTRADFTLSLHTPNFFVFKVEPNMSDPFNLHHRQKAGDLMRMLKNLNKYGKPIIITENGMNTDKDSRRCAYIQNVFAVLKKAVARGIPVTGYFYWSLMDNYEWHYGYVPKFGLHSVEPGTFKRQPKNSAAVYADEISKFRLYLASSGFSR